MADYMSNNKNTQPVVWWARRLNKTFKDMFNPDTPGGHPVPDLSDGQYSTATAVDSTVMSVPNLWKTYSTRKNVYQDIERMDNEDETVAAALDIIADCSLSFSETAGSVFRITSDDATVQNILTEFSRRVDLPNEIWQIVRDMVKHGNEFREVIIDRQKMHIIALKQTVSYHLWPNTNEMGDKISGWLVREDRDIYTSQAGKLLAEWQLCPFIFGSKRGFLAVPPLASARRNWLRLSKIEDSMAIARLVRAYDKLVHRIPVKVENSRDEIMARIRSYKDAMSKRRMLDTESTEAPLDVNSDFFIPDDGTGRGGVSILSSNNAQLTNLNDLIYHREKLLTRLQVPVTYLQIISAQKSHVASQGKKAGVDIQFARMLRRVQRCLESGLRRACDLELLLHGVEPKDGLYTIHMTQIDTQDMKDAAETELTFAQAAVYFVEAFGMLPPELLADKFMVLSPDQQKLMDKFLNTYGDKITKAKVATLETAAQGSGSGNNNKPVVNRSTEQIGKINLPNNTNQGIPIDDLVDLFSDLQEEIRIDLRIQGILAPDVNDSYRYRVRDALEKMANIPDEVLLDQHS